MDASFYFFVEYVLRGSSHWRIDDLEKLFEECVHLLLGMTDLSVIRLNPSKVVIHLVKANIVNGRTYCTFLHG